MSQDNLEIVRRWWATFNEEGMPALDLCDEQVEISNPPAFPVRGSYHGHDGVRQWRTDVFEVIDDVNVEAEELFDAGDGETVVMFLRLRGFAIYTRIPIDEIWAAVWKIRGGKLVHAQGYISRREALEAAGLSE